MVVTGLPFGNHRRNFYILTSWLIAGLERIGVSGAGQAGICDLILGDRKVGGACLHRARDLLYYSASLLVDPDMDKVARYLKHPPREPTYRQQRGHASFMGPLRTALSADDALDHLHHVDLEHVATRLRRALQPPVALLCATTRLNGTSRDRERQDTSL